MDELDLRPWDPAEHLRDHRDCIGALDVALQYDDPVGVIETIGDIARSKQLTDVVRGIANTLARITLWPPTASRPRCGH